MSLRKELAQKSLALSDHNYRTTLRPHEYERYLHALYHALTNHHYLTTRLPQNQLLQRFFNSFRITVDRNIRVMRAYFIDLFPVPCIQYSLSEMVVAAGWALNSFRIDPKTHLHALLVIQYHESDLASMVGVRPVLFQRLSQSPEIIYQPDDETVEHVAENPSENYLREMLENDTDVQELEMLLGGASISEG